MPINVGVPVSVIHAQKDSNEERLESHANALSAVSYLLRSATTMSAVLNAVKASGRNVTSKKNVSTIGKTAKNIVNRFYAEIVKKILFQVIP